MASLQTGACHPTLWRPSGEIPSSVAAISGRVCLGRSLENLHIQQYLANDSADSLCQFTTVGECLWEVPHPPIWVGALIWVVFCIPSSALSPLAGAPVLTDKNKRILSKIWIPDQKTFFLAQVCLRCIIIIVIIKKTHIHLKFKWNGHTASNMATFSLN